MKTIILLCLTLASQAANFIGDGSGITNLIGPLSIKDRGAGGDGVIEETVFVQAAMDESLDIFISPGVHLVGNLYPRHKQHIHGDGSLSVLRFLPGATGWMIEAGTNSIRLGFFDADGGDNINRSTLTNVGFRSGIHLSSIGRNSFVSGVNVDGFAGTGIGFNGKASLPGYPAPPWMAGVNVVNCYIGIDTGVGGTNGAEYMTFTSCTSYGNRYGVVINSGNMALVGCHLDGNGIGLTLTDAYNQAHGTFTGGTINHNKIYGIMASNVIYGFTFSGNQIWKNDSYFTNCTGINIQGVNFGTSGMAMSGGGVNIFKNNWFNSNQIFKRTNDNWIVEANPYGPGQFIE